jgi:hypothetical protein
MIKLIDLLIENSEYKIELKNGKIINKFLSDKEYENMVNNINAPKGIVKSIERIGKEPEKNIEKPINQEPKEDSDITPREFKMWTLSDPTFFDIIYKEEIVDKAPHGEKKYETAIRTPMKLAGYALNLEQDPKNVMSYLEKNLQNDYVYQNDAGYFINYVNRVRKDYDAISNVGLAITKMINNNEDKLNASDSDIKTYLQYWESKYNNHKKNSKYYNDVIKFLKTKINPFK